MNKTKNRVLSIISILTFAITLIVNYGSMLGWFGMTQKEVSDKYESLILLHHLHFQFGD